MLLNRQYSVDKLLHRLRAVLNLVTEMRSAVADMLSTILRLETEKRALF